MTEQSYAVECLIGCKTSSKHMKIRICVDLSVCVCVYVCVSVYLVLYHTLKNRIIEGTSIFVNTFFHFSCVYALHLVMIIIRVLQIVEIFYDAMYNFLQYVNTSVSTYPTLYIGPY